MKKLMVKNPKAVALFNIALGLNVASLHIHKVVTKSATNFNYFAVVIGLIILALGIYNYIKNQNTKFVHEYILGYFYILFGVSFLVLNSISWYNATMPIYSIILAAAGSLISIGTGIALIKK